MKLTLRQWKKSDYATLVVVGLCTWFSLFPAENSIFSWWESHAFELMLFLLFGGLLFFFINRSRLTFIFFAGCSLLCYFLNERTNATFKPANLTENALSLRIGTFNFSADPTIDSALCAITDANPDILAIQDIPMTALPEIHQFLEQSGYHYFQFEPDRERHLETAMYSRLPIEFLPSIRHRDTPVIFGKMRLTNAIDSLRELYFISTSLSGAGQTSGEIANKLYSMAGQLGMKKAPVFAMGNFNLVPWSQQIQSFKHQSALQNSRRGVQFASRQGYFTLFDPPTEHIFYSDHFKCVNFETISCGGGPTIGLIGTYQLVKKGLTYYAEKESQKL